MEERIEAKIEEIVNTIIERPLDELKPEDYGILSNELVRLENKRNAKQRKEKFAELMANTMF